MIQSASEGKMNPTAASHPVESGSTPDWLRIAGTVLLLGSILALTTNRQVYDIYLMLAWVSLTLGGTIILHLRAHPSITDALLIPILAGAVGAFDLFVLHFPLNSMGCLSLLGFSSLAILGFRTIWCTTQRSLLRRAFWPAVLFCLLTLVSGHTLPIVTMLHPKTLDLYLYSFDCSLGMQIPFLVGHWLMRSHWLFACTMWFYMGLPPLLAFVYAAQLKNGTRGRTALVAFLITGPVGILFYNIFPAVGPVHAFPSFPIPPLETWQVSHLALEAIAVPGARNAIPSLHMTWALLAFWNSRHTARWVRLIALLFVVFTILSTLGSGEHYFVDLIVALPFALMIQGLASIRFDKGLPSPWRAAVVTGAFMSFAWLGLLSFAVPEMWLTPAIPWALCALTVAASLVIYRNLQSQLEGPAEELSA